MQRCHKGRADPVQSGSAHNSTTAQYTAEYLTCSPGTCHADSNKQTFILCSFEKDCKLLQGFPSLPAPPKPDERFTRKVRHAPALHMQVAEVLAC